MKPEASRIWQKLTQATATNPNAQAGAQNGEVVVGDFSARIKGVESSPEQLSAYVGWRISASIPEGTKGYVAHHYVSSSDGSWVDMESEEVWSDDGIVQWLTRTLDEWVRSNGCVAPTDPDLEYP